MNEKIKLLISKSYSGVPFLETINPLLEEEKEYYCLILDNFHFSTNKLIYLAVPNDNSNLVNQFKNFISGERETIGVLSCPASNLRLNSDLIKKRGFEGDGLLVKDTSQMEISSFQPKVINQITFKVISQKKTRKAGFRPESYSHELEIEPFSLGIEGMPAISRISFDFFPPEPLNDLKGEELGKGLAETYLYNSKMLAESEGKVFKMGVRWLRIGMDDNSLHFATENDLDLDSFQEKLPKDKPNNVQLRTDVKQTITKLLTDNNLKTSDLATEFHQWETDLAKLDTETEIKEFQQKLEKEIQTIKNKKQSQLENNQNKGLSLSVKLLIGGGVMIVIIGLVSVLWLKFKRKQRKI